MQRDTLINANTLARLGRDTYTQEDLDNFERLLKVKESLIKMNNMMSNYYSSYYYFKREK